MFRTSEVKESQGSVHEHHQVIPMLLAPRHCTALIGCPRSLILGHRVLTLSKYMFNYLYMGDAGCTSRCKISYFTVIFLCACMFKINVYVRISLGTLYKPIRRYV
jgi:hypothetical protein